MNRCYSDVGKETEMDESAAMAAAPPRTTNGDGLIHSAGPATYEATAHGQGNVVALGLSHSDQFVDAPAENTRDRHRQEASSSPGMSRGQIQAIPTNISQAAPSSLDALALACAQYERDGNTTMDVSTGTSTPVVSNTTNEGSVTEEATDVTDSHSTGKTTTNPSGDDITVASEVLQNDVLCGRGGLTNHHPGNVFFRRMVRMKQESYLRASKRDKAGVARDIVETIRRLDPPGRFLKKDASNPGKWVEIGDRKAREKTSQALREGAPELREELTGANKGKQQTQVQFATAPITAAEKEQALQATINSTHRGRVVSSDSMNGSGWTEVNLAQYQGAYNASNGMGQPHMIVDETTAATATVTPLTLTPSASSSSEEPMDTSSGTTTPPPQGTNYCGTKRKLEDGIHQSCSWHEMEQDSPSSSSSSSSKRGPRMKLLKARMMEFCR